MILRYNSKFECLAFVFYKKDMEALAIPHDKQPMVI